VRADATYFPGRSADIYFRPPPSGYDAHATLAPTASTHEEDAQTQPGSTPALAPQLSAVPRSVLAPDAAAPARPEQQEKGALDTIKDKLAAALPSVAKPLVAGAAAGAAADIKIGSLGILHPSVLKAFELDYPCSSLEFDVEPFL
jgi:phenylalanyl-tRNA synthetase beta chain